MDSNKEIQALLTKMEETNRRQLRTARFQCIFTVLIALCCIALLVMTVGILPRVDALLTQLQATLTALEQFGEIDIDALNRAIENLADVIEPLASFFSAFG